MKLNPKRTSPKAAKARITKAEKQSAKESTAQQAAKPVKSQFDATPKPETVKSGTITTNRTDDSFNGQVKVTMSGTEVIAKTGEVESTVEAQKDDVARANALATGQPAPVGMVVFEESEDKLSARKDAQIWNLNLAEQFDVIGLRDNSNILHRFEYVPQVLTVETAKGTKKTPFSILTCSDTGAIVGKPFNPATYGLLNNSDFIGVIETICAVLDKMGIPWAINTTGNLMNRERMFISIHVKENEQTTIDGREFHAFLNCLNSIPSNAGCTVTFSNNTFCVCCRNTFAHALTGRDGAKFHAAIKHTSGMKPALNDIPVLVEAYFANNEALFKQLKAFHVFPVKLEEAEQFFAAFVGRDLKGNLTDKNPLKTRSANIVETLKNLFVNGKGNKGQTALDVFQAVTEYYTHFSAGETEDKTKQVESSEIGSGAVNKGEFYQWLVQATQAKTNWQAVAKVGETLLVSYRKQANEKGKW